MNNIRYYPFITGALSLALLLPLSFLTSCAHTQKTTTVDTTTTQTSPPLASTQVTTTTETHSTSNETPPPVVKEKPRGLLGGIFGAIGAIIAFPFKLVAGIVEAIF